MHMVHLQRHTVISSQFRKFARDSSPNHPQERGRGKRGEEIKPSEWVVTGVVLSFTFPLGNKAPLGSLFRVDFFLESLP